MMFDPCFPTFSKKKNDPGEDPKMQPKERRYVFFFFFFLLMIFAVSLFFNAPRLYITHSFHNPLTTESFDLACFIGYSWKTGLFLVFSYLLACLLGYSLFGYLFRRSFDGSFLIKILACFFLGFVCTASLVRILSFVQPFYAVYIAVFFLILLLSILSLHRCHTPDLAKRKNFAPQGMSDVKAYAGHLAAWILFFAIFLSFVLLLQVHQGQFSWIGHGRSQYPVFLEQWRQGGLLHFPVITQHYAELIFHYFLMGNLPSSLDPTVVFWTTLAFVKLSLFLFIFLCLRELGCSSFFSFLSGAFLFLGTSSLDPSKYYMLFDSSNPLFCCVHADRVIGIGLVLVFLMHFVNARCHRKIMPLWVAFLFCLGISATSISNSLWVLFVVFLFTIYSLRALDNNKTEEACHPFETQDGYLSIDHHICFFSLAGVCMLYLLPFEPALAPYALRLLIVFIAIFLAARRLWQLIQKAIGAGGVKKFFFNKTWYLFFCVLGAFILGHVFLGNIAVENPLSKNMTGLLGKVFGQTSYVSTAPTIAKGLSRDGTLAIGDFRELGSWSEYSKSLVFFIAYYGLVFVCILLTDHLFRRAKKRKVPVYFCDGILYELFLFCLAVLPCLFFVTDFWDIGMRTWYKTRLFEIPVYIFLFVFFYAIHRFARPAQKMIISIVLVLYMIVPFVRTERFLQIRENFYFMKYLINIQQPYR